jgi:hypothetical protein
MAATEINLVNSSSVSWSASAPYPDPNNPELTVRDVTATAITVPINWRGAWSSSTSYAVGDAVSLAGASYICISANTNETPPNATYWGLLSSAGSSGAPTTDEYIIGAADSALPNAAVWPALYNHPDIPPSSPNAMNDEFDASSFNSSSLWAWVNQGNASASQSKSVLALAGATTSGERAIVQACPSPTWQVTAKISLLGLTSGQNAWGGLTLRDGTGSSAHIIDFQWYPFEQGLNVMHLSGNTTFTSNVATFNMNTSACRFIYLQIKSDGTNLYFSFSMDGIHFLQIYHEACTSFLASVAYVGLVVDNWSGYSVDGNGNVPIVCCDWFRRTL